MPKLAVADGRWDAEEARRVLDALDESGLSVQEFARRTGLKPDRLYRWRRSQPPAPLATPRAQFVEIQAVAATSAVIELSLRSGRQLRFSERVDLDVVARLAALLDESTC